MKVSQICPSATILGLIVWTATAAPLHIRQTGFQQAGSDLPAGWTVWSARPEITPRTYVDRTHFRTGPGSLAISGNSNAAEYGGWEYLVPDIEAGKWYRFTAYYRSAGLQDEARQVVTRLDW